MTSLFISGTDTGVGKTRVATALLSALVTRGQRAVGMKPVAAGFMPDRAENEDVVALAEAGNVVAASQDICPYAFAAPIAPHLAAAQAGVAIDLARLLAAYARLAQGADAVVVEGVGGPLVPIDERHDLLDFARALSLPVVLVVGLRLGCLNHALLCAQAIVARGLSFAGWVANEIDPHMAEREANVATLRQRLPGPLLARFPWSPGRGQEPAILLDSAPGEALARAWSQALGVPRS
ncbi:dethiobiotin synthetase [Burkholderiales bacterium]|nr:MAG: dethiobiotin synthase [Burkholderiales bacterium]CAG0961716.1 dethiobiotin synthetase [Burkholderiales bacterium]